MPAQICWRSPPSLNRSGDRSGQQPPGAPQQRDPPAHRRRRYLPRPRRAHPPGRCRAGRTTRRMDRIPPLPRPRRPQQITSRPQLTTRTGGTRPGGPNRLTMSRRITRQPVHHAHGLDPIPPEPNSARWCNRQTIPHPQWHARMLAIRPDFIQGTSHAAGWQNGIHQSTEDHHPADRRPFAVAEEYRRQFSTQEALDLAPGESGGKCGRAHRQQQPYSRLLGAA